MVKSRKKEGDERKLKEQREERGEGEERIKEPGRESVVKRKSKRNKGEAVERKSWRERQNGCVGRERKSI